MKGNYKMNIGVVFAGGVGKRMKTNGTPKQFLKINGVPIIIHTLKIFENAENIDSIVVSCVATHIDLLKGLVKEYNIHKVKEVVEGGKTGQESIINGLIAAKKIGNGENDIVLIHDGVRPIIDEGLINRNIIDVKKYGTSISCAQQRETTVLSETGETIDLITDRKTTYVARAPQAFYLKDILEAENLSIANNDYECIDSCSVMRKYGKYKNPHITICENSNLKITTPEDYFIAEALINNICKI